MLIIISAVNATALKVLLEGLPKIQAHQRKIFEIIIGIVSRNFSGKASLKIRPFCDSEQKRSSFVRRETK